MPTNPEQLNAIHESPNNRAYAQTKLETNGLQELPTNPEQHNATCRIPKKRAFAQTEFEEYHLLSTNSEQLHATCKPPKCQAQAQSEMETRNPCVLPTNPSEAFKRLPQPSRWMNDDDIRLSLCPSVVVCPRISFQNPKNNNIYLLIKETLLHLEISSGYPLSFIIEDPPKYFAAMSVHCDHMGQAVIIYQDSMATALPTNPSCLAWKLIDGIGKRFGYPMVIDAQILQQTEVWDGGAWTAHNLLALFSLSEIQLTVENVIRTLSGIPSTSVVKLIEYHFQRKLNCLRTFPTFLSAPVLLTTAESSDEPNYPESQTHPTDDYEGDTDTYLDILDLDDIEMLEQLLFGNDEKCSAECIVYINSRQTLLQTQLQHLRQNPPQFVELQLHDLHQIICHKALILETSTLRSLCQDPLCPHAHMVPIKYSQQWKDFVDLSTTVLLSHMKEKLDANNLDLLFIIHPSVDYYYHPTKLGDILGDFSNAIVRNRMVSVTTTAPPIRSIPPLEDKNLKLYD